MLVVRKEQLAVLEKDSRLLFENRAVNFIASDYPIGYARLGEPGTRGLIAHAIQIGGVKGITTEGGVLCLAALMVQYGLDFERSPDQRWALDLLDHPTLPGSVKIDIVMRHLSGRSRGRVVVMQGEV